MFILRWKTQCLSYSQTVNLNLSGYGSLLNPQTACRAVVLKRRTKVVCPPLLLIQDEHKKNLRWRQKYAVGIFHSIYYENGTLWSG